MCGGEVRNEEEGVGRSRWRKRGRERVLIKKRRGETGKGTGE